VTKDEALKLALEALELVNLEFVCANGSHHAKQDRHEWDEDCPITDRWRKAITAIKQALAAPESEPVQATMKLESSGPGYGPAPKQKLSVRHVSLIDAGKTSAQPAVPDAIGPNEDELPAYAAGWNDCRAEMLRGMKP
jgi:hypothetical protein